MILDEIAAHARFRVEADKQARSLGALRETCAAIGRDRSGRTGGGFRGAIARTGLSFICEVKKASPSKGVISPDFPYLSIVSSYEAAGADAISCLTEPRWFGGSDDIFVRIRSEVSVPLLRKDFVIDEYQIYQARAMGADAVLLICSLLDGDAIEQGLRLCDDLGMDALVEAHDEAEVATAVAAGAGIIGINNRNLKDFTVDTGNAARLRDAVPPACLFVAESGVNGPRDVAMLHASGADAVLVGEHLMRSQDRGAALRALREATR